VCDRLAIHGALLAGSVEEPVCVAKSRVRSSSHGVYYCDPEQELDTCEFSSRDLQARSRSTCRGIIREFRKSDQANTLGISEEP